MIVHLTEEEAAYLRDRPFWDWKRAELDNHTIMFLARNRKGYATQSMIRKEKFYYDLYKKLGGKEIKNENDDKIRR